jgi:hypothetical protein
VVKVHPDALAEVLADFGSPPGGHQRTANSKMAEP